MSKHTIDNIEKTTGLSKNFIRKSIKIFEDILKPTRGSKNAYCFDDNALVIFQQIGEKKKDGLSLPEIEKSIREDLEGGQTGKTESKQKSNREQTGGQAYSNSYSNYKNTNKEPNPEILEIKSELLEKDKIILEKDRIILGKDKTIFERDTEIVRLQTQLKLEAPKAAKEPVSFWGKFWWLPSVVAVIVGLVVLWFVAGQNWWLELKNLI